MKMLRREIAVVDPELCSYQRGAGIAYKLSGAPRTFFPNYSGQGS